ncbi:MAG: universal stress protein [Acidobacteria bacterium]|nr:universal stress protein [Acidobacteriota bacterium]
MVKAKKILIPTDFSEHSQFALQHAVNLAERSRAKVYVMHVHQPSQEYSVPELLAEVEQNEREKLRVITDKVRSRGIDAEAVYAVGKPHSSIVSTAKKLDVDLITLATRGLRGLTYLVFGSTAEKVVRLAHCPVLTVKHRE